MITPRGSSFFITVTGPAEIGIPVGSPEKDLYGFPGLAGKGVGGVAGGALEPSLIIERKVLGYGDFLGGKNPCTMSGIMENRFAGIGNGTVMAGKTHLGCCNLLLMGLGHELTIPVFGIKGIDPLEVTYCTLFSRIRLIRVQHLCPGRSRSTANKKSGTKAEKPECYHCISVQPALLKSCSHRL